MVAKKISSRKIQHPSITPTGRLQYWLQSGWHDFIKNPGWHLVEVILFTLFSIGTFNLISPIFMASLVYTYDTQSHNKPFKIAHWWAHLQRNIKPLLAFCLIYIALLIIFYIILELPIRTYITHHPSMAGLFIVLILACQLLFCGSFFASALIMLKAQKAIAATQIGFLALIKNSGNILLLNGMLLAAIALPVILWQSWFKAELSPGVLVLFLVGTQALLAIFLCTLYAAYRDLFLNIPAPSLQQQ